MPSLKKDMVVRNLSKKGFEQNEGDHLYLTYVRADGRRTSIRTKVSHGSKSDITTGLISAMARQCHITTQQSCCSEPKSWGYLMRNATLYLLPCPRCVEQANADARELGVVL